MELVPGAELIPQRSTLRNRMTADISIVLNSLKLSIFSIITLLVFCQLIFIMISYSSEQNQIISIIQLKI
jgi:hypothetical protein